MPRGTNLVEYSHTLTRSRRAAGRGLLSPCILPEHAELDAPGDFFSQLRGLFRRVSTYGFSTTHPLSRCDRHCYSPLQSLYTITTLFRFSRGAGASPCQAVSW